MRVILAIVRIAKWRYFRDVTRRVDSSATEQENGLGEQLGTAATDNGGTTEILEQTQ
jgi:hypothetical protein